MTSHVPRPRWTAFVCSMASYIDAAAILTWSTVLVIYQQTRGLNELEIGLGNGALTATIAVGAVVGGYLGDRLGRRPVFVVTMALILFGTIGMMFAGSTPLMLAVTMLAGLGIGADLPVSTSTIAEAASSESRGRLLGMTALFWLAGAILPGVLAAIVGDLGELGAVILLAHIAIVTAFTLVARLTIPESAVWLAAKANRLRGAVTLVKRASVVDLLRKPYRTPFLALVVFAAFGAIGTGVIGHYSTYMLVNFAGTTVSSAAMITIIAVPFGLVGGLLFMKAAGGKRRFLYFKIAITVNILVALVPIFFGFSVATFILVLAVGAFAAAFSGDALQKVWTQQSFPALLRNTAQGAVFAVARTAITIFATLGPLLLAVDINLVFGIMVAGGVIAGGTAWAVFRTWDRHDAFREEDATVAAVNEPRAITGVDAVA